ncbi:LPXTG cell wall anchor domain-containing protein [Actinoplanes derwentensis]|uniref:LPXTG-motif cell wall anchor domain-containing protein n=1 Tax=Actinoplanes derwentensis TaxID=113562 RepID=A0A1H2D5X3_9ACTN|nr:LPXTG cell wall anchor domain-containing protein [Actinoplanes derwentensis]SDT78131.1 LPXTG-motif cell wall anchor domain-containing protein [Actinoplanes derwentensis]
MSFSRRLAAGITTVGASVLIVLAPSGASAATAADVTAATAADATTVTAADATAVTAADVAVVAAEAAPVAPVAPAAAAVDLAVTTGHMIITPVTPAPTTPAPTTSAAADAPQRGSAGYGTNVQEAPGGEVSPATGTAPPTTPAATASATGAPVVTPTRGGPGYTPPSSPPPASPSVTPGTPGGIAGSQTPTGVKSASAKVTTPSSPNPVGLKDASELPLTGASVDSTLTLGGLLVAGGVLTVWFTRRRRTS